MRGIRHRHWHHPGVNHEDLTLSERAAEQMVNFFGSWAFVGWQTFVVIGWMFLNTYHGWHLMWDGYPFILLNLAFSTQAAYAAPLVMIGQKRNAQLSGERDAHDHLLLTEIHQMLSRQECES